MDASRFTILMDHQEQEEDMAINLLAIDIGAVADVVEIWMTLSPEFSGYRVMRQRQAFADPS